jgi:hypothetical protein
MVEGKEVGFKRKRDELASRILPYLEAGTVPPPILPQQYASAKEMINMLQSLVLMVATIFQKTVNANTKSLLDLSIRSFLTCFQQFNEPMRKMDCNPNWLLTYNMMCLLNLPATIEEFGPVRQWYKGKWLGEQYVLTVKSERLKCPLNNLHYILLRNLHHNKAIDMLHQNNQEQNDKEDLLPVLVHTSKDKLLGSFLSRTPFPTMSTTHGQYYSLFYGATVNL